MAYDRQTALFRSWTVHGKALFRQPMTFQVWRAPTDNDQNVQAAWRGAGYDRLRPRVYRTALREGDGGCVIESEVALVPDQMLAPMIRMDVRWSVGPDGSLSLETRVRVEEAAPFLPRFGIRLFLDAGLEKAAYFGYGPHESYVDAHRATHMGRFHTTLRDG